MNIYQKAHDRLEQLRRAPLDQVNNCNQMLFLKHRDGTELKYPSCYFEVLSSRKRKDKEIVKCVVIIPEHHAPAWYDLEDLEVLSELNEDGEVLKSLL